MNVNPLVIEVGREREREREKNKVGSERERSISTSKYLKTSKAIDKHGKKVFLLCSSKHL